MSEQRYQYSTGETIPDYAPPTRWQRLRAAIWRERLMYLLILPGVIYFLTFTYLPLMANVIAFQEWNPFRASLEGPIKGFLSGPWVGLDQFRLMFTDPHFTNALINTIQIELLLLIFAFPAP